MPVVFAGLDVSDQTTVICIMDQMGLVLAETSVKTKPEAIAEVLKPFRRGLRAVGLEAGDTTTWLTRELTAARYHVVSLDPFRAHSALRARLNKTDTNDARGIAELLARNIYTVAHVKSDRALRIKTSLLLRAAIARRATALKQAVRVSHRAWGGETVKTKRRATRPQDSPEVELLALTRDTTQRMAAAMADQANILLKALTRMAREDEVCARLMAIPGVGAITALNFIAAIDDPTRFSSSREVGAYLGLTLWTFQSGNVTGQGHISKRGDPDVRAALYNAAHSLISASHSTCRLRRWALALAATKGERLARVACARKLAVLMHRLWITGEEFDPKR